MCILARRLADAPSRASTYCSDISVDRFDKQLAERMQPLSGARLLVPQQRKTSFYAN